MIFVIIFSLFSAPSLVLAFKLSSNQVPKSIFNQTSLFLFLLSGTNCFDLIEVKHDLSKYHFLRYLPHLIFGSTDGYNLKARKQNVILWIFSDHKVLFCLPLVQHFLSECLFQVDFVHTLIILYVFCKN